MKKKICLLGGTGFVGRHLTNELANRGYALRIVTRRRERHRELWVHRQLETVEGNVHNPGSLKAAFEGCAAVINLVGILNPHSGCCGDFESVHAKLPGTVAAACLESGVDRLLHMSALNASPDAPSEYLRTKAKGEDAAHEAAKLGLKVTSFQPSVIFGEDDSFFNRFAGLLALSPVMPLACPEARFAPVYIEDVVRAFANSLEDKSTIDKRYQLCGPEVYTLRELVTYTARATGRRRLIVGFSDGLSQLQASILERMPGTPFSRDNYNSMQTDSVCSQNGLRELGIEPTFIDTVVPNYLGGRTTAALYGAMRAVANR